MALAAPWRFSLPGQDLAAPGSFTGHRSNAGRPSDPSRMTSARCGASAPATRNTRDSVVPHVCLAAWLRREELVLGPRFGMALSTAHRRLSSPMMNGPPAAVFMAQFNGSVVKILLCGNPNGSPLVTGNPNDSPLT